MHTLGKGALLALGLIGVRAHAQDLDGDGRDDFDGSDNCPGIANPGQEDVDADGWGDACVDVDAVVAATATLGSGVRLDRRAYAGEYASLGARSTLAVSATLADGVDSLSGTSLGMDGFVGRRARMDAGASAGADATLARLAVLGARTTAGDALSLGYSSTVGVDGILGDTVILGNLVQVGDRVSIGSSATIARNTVIQDDVTIGASAILGPEVALASHALIGASVRFRKRASAGEGAEVGGEARIGRDVVIEAGATIGEGAHLASGVRVTANSTVDASARIPRGTVVDNGVIELVVVSGSRRWADGTLDVACWDYLSPSGAPLYAAATEDGAYRVDPDGAGPIAPFDVYCDMNRQGGGWTLVDNDATLIASFSSRPVGAITDPSVTGGRRLPGYSWSADPLLLCRSSRYTGTVGWLTLEAGGAIARQYPTAITQTASHTAGWAPRALNGNTNYGMTSWIYNADSRFGSVWIGAGHNSTCSCNYTGASTGLGTYGATSDSTCSTWVR